MKNRLNINETRQNSEQFTQTGNMMSRGSAGRGQRVRSRRLRLMDLSIKRELILPTVSLGPTSLECRGNSLQQAAQGQTACLLKLLSVMARKSGSALLIDQSKGNKATNLQTQSRKPIELASFPARSIAI